jgi:hypothetical protein
MTDAVGKLISAILLVLTIVITMLYILNPEPAEAPTVSVVILGSLGLIVVLTPTLMWRVMGQVESP